MKYTWKNTKRWLVSELGALASEMLGTFGWILLYFVIGAAIAVPYTLLAGGDLEAYVMTVLVSPIAVFIMLLGWCMRPIGRDRSKTLGAGDCLFLAFVGYLSLPIILNGVSLLLGWAGYETAAHIVFAVRYPVLILIPTTLFVGLLIIGGVMNIWMKTKRHWRNTPPTPPSSPGAHLGARSESPSQQNNDELSGGQSQVLLAM